MKHTLLLITALLAAGNALADDPPPPKLDHLAECRADVQKLCANVQPGGGRIVACLRDNLDKVSDACKQKLQEMRQHRGGNRQGGQPGSTNNN